MDPQRKFIEIDLKSKKGNEKVISYKRPLRPTFAGITAKPSTNPRLFNTFPHNPSNK
jgi:hypothetical protein